jgi:hypothetical protein
MDQCHFQNNNTNSLQNQSDAFKIQLIWSINN